MSKLLSSTASFETLPPPYPGLVDNPIYLIQKYSTHSRPLDLRLDAQLRNNAGIGSARQSATVTDLKDLKQLFRFGEKQNGQQMVYDTKGNELILLEYKSSLFHKTQMTASLAQIQNVITSSQSSGSKKILCSTVFNQSSSSGSNKEVKITIDCKNKDPDKHQRKGFLFINDEKVGLIAYDEKGKGSYTFTVPVGIDSLMISCLMMFLHRLFEERDPLGIKFPSDQPDGLNKSNWGYN